MSEGLGSEGSGLLEVRGLFGSRRVAPQHVHVYPGSRQWLSLAFGIPLTRFYGVEA